MPTTLNPITGQLDLVDNLQSATDRGATTDNIIGVPGVQFDVAATPATSAPGLIQWNTVDGTYDMGLLNSSVLQVGQETMFYGKASGAIANGDLCQFAGVQGDHILIKKAVGSEIEANPHFLIGVATENISNGNFGYVTWFGKINGIYTKTPANQDSTNWIAGDILYFNVTTGQLTKTMPSVPNRIIHVAAVIKEQTGASENGIIIVRPTFGIKLQDLDDVNGTPLTTTGQIPVWNNTGKYFDFDKNLLDYVPYTGATSDVDLGTHNLATKEINQYATAEYDGPVLGPELLDDTGWTSTGYTGSWSTGWTAVSPGSPGTLSRTMTLSVGHTYQLSYTIPNPDGWGQNITFYLGGAGPVVSLSQGSYSTTFVAVDSSDLIMTPDSLYDATIFLSVKELTEKKSIFNIYDSSNTKVFEIQSSTAGLKNQFVGLSSGAKTTTGYENVSFGGLSLFENIGGYQNTSLGYKSLYTATSGYRNVAIGAYSLYANTAYDNVALGAYSLYNNDNGFSVGIGAYSLYNNLGAFNVAIGASALYSAISGTGFNNVAIGREAMKNNSSGYTNVAIGYWSLVNNTTGYDNLAIGYNSGYLIAAGTANVNSIQSTFLGGGTRASVANGVNEIVIGYATIGNGSNTVTLGNTSITGTYLRGDINFVDGKNLILGTTTGMKIGTATTQKIGFYNATPVVQQIATTDLGTVLSNLGLRATGTAYPITTSGAVSFTGNFTHNTGTATFSNGFTIADARNIVLNTTTGTKIGTATTQKLSFFNSTPIVQPANTVAIDTTLVNLGLRASGGDANFATRVTQPGTFAEIYVADGSTAQSIASGATYTKLTAFTTNGSSSNCTADATNDKITITKAGKYLVNVQISGHDGVAGATFKAALFYDGTEQSKIHSTTKFNAGGEIDSMSMSGILVAAANKDVDVRLAHDGGAAVDFTTQYANLTVTYIGE